MTVRFVVDAQGMPRAIRVQEGGSPGFSEAAVRVAERMRFLPAHFRGQAVPAWVSIPIIFQPRQ